MVKNSKNFTSGSMWYLGFCFEEFHEFWKCILWDMNFLKKLPCFNV